MKRNTLFLPLIFSLTATFFSLYATGQSEVKLSPQATISILTCAPGDELYASFGHTGIRVTDKANHLDIVFNYGTFDFNTQGFYFKFARGLLPYQLTISRFDHFILPYIHEKRSVYAQTLNLDSIQKQRLIDLLLKNHKPEHRSYLYNFLYNNCTTKARDMLQKSTDNQITWNTKTQHKSFWNLLDEYLQRSPWIQWGIHTILGSPATRDASNWEQMFLPDYLMYGLDSAYYKHSRLAQPIEIIYQAPDETSPTPWYFTPFFVFLCTTSILIFTLHLAKSRLFFKIIVTLNFIATGLIGCLIIFLGFFTAHPTMFPNYNILWANPLNLIVIFFIFKKHIPRIIQKYLSLYIGLLCIGFILWLLLAPATVPSTMLLFIWMLYLTFHVKQISPCK